jgi:hypothetical protein
MTWESSPALLALIFALQQGHAHVDPHVTSPA